MKIDKDAKRRNISVSLVDLMFMICSTASTMSLSMRSDLRNRELFSRPTNVPTVERTVSG